jgi:nitroreductase
MELLQGINSRQSIRGFQPTPVPEALLREVLSTAGRSPSYKNTQPWEIAIVSGAKRDALSKILFDLASTGTRPDY